VKSKLTDRVSFGDVEVNPGTHDVRRRGEPVTLRPKEYDLLIALLQRRGQVVSRGELLEEVWGYSGEVYSRTVDTHVAELRRKLEDNAAEPRHILTVRKTGYRIQS
jgi:DNA-binding response OmpR family regulator